MNKRSSRSRSSSRRRKQWRQFYCLAFFLLIAFVSIKILGCAKVATKGLLTVNSVAILFEGTCDRLLACACFGCVLFFGAVNARSTRRASVHIALCGANETIFDTELFPTNATMVNLSSSNKRCHNAFAERTGVYVLRLGCSCFFPLLVSERTEDARSAARMSKGLD